MTTSPSEPVDNAQLSDDAEPSSTAGDQRDDGGGTGGDTHSDQDAEPTSTAPESDNPTVPDPPD